MSTPKKKKSATDLDPDEFMAASGGVAEPTSLDPEAFMGSASSTPSPGAPPPQAPLGIGSLIGSFLGGTKGSTGGLSDLIPSPSGILHMFTSPFETSREIAQQSFDTYKDSKQKGFSTPLALATGIPFIGPPSKAAAEAIASDDPLKKAAGAGSTTALLAPFGLGRVLGKGVGKLPVAGKIAPALEEIAATSATKSYTRALVPPTKKLALAAREVAPTIAGAGAEAMTRPQFTRWIGQKVAEAGKSLEARLQFHGQAPLDKPALLDRLKAAADPHVNPITETHMTPEGANAIATVSEIVSDADKALGPNPTVSDLVRYKRAMDSMITQGKKAPFAELANSGKLSYYKDAANILRDTLNKVHPDIEAANKNFSTFKKAESVMKESNKAALAGEIRSPGAAGKLGLGPHTTVTGALVKAWEAISFKKSPWWNTLVGSQKMAVNQALKTGNFAPIENLLIMAQVTQPPPSKPTYFPDMASAGLSASGAPPPPPPLGVPEP